MVIRSSRHYYRINNKIKTQWIHDFLDHYIPAVQQFIDFIWVNPLPWQTKKGEPRLLDIQHLILDCPKDYDYKIVTFDTPLDARALSSAMSQALGIVKSKTNDVRKRRFALEKAIEEGSGEKKIERLQKRWDKSIKNLQKPKIGYYGKAELSSKNCTLERKKSAKHFEYWLKFHALGTHKPFCIPIKLNRQDYKTLNKHFNTMGSFLIGRDYVEIRYKKDVEMRKTGETIGCDTGIKCVATFSNQKNEIDNVNGVTYDEAVKRCARKRKGSRNYQEALKHRDNIARAILNKVSFENVKQINLEDNGNLKYKQRTNRYLRCHAYGVIKEKVEQVAEEFGVRVQMQTSNYKSQRCSGCGWTQKYNRNGKKFKCKKCGYKDDADHNASENNRLKLRWLDFGSISEQKLNIQGFEWEEIVGEESGVPHSVQSDEARD